MAQDKVKALYDTFVKEGYNMESEAEFRKNLADPAKRKAAYEALKKDGYEMEAYDAFETNIGYGKAQPTSAPTATPAPQPQADVKTTPAPAAPNPQSAPSPAPAPQETQATWHPTVQDKIRMSHSISTMLNDFRQQSQARIEQARRATMPMTTEGRRKLKAGKFQAQLAGTPTKMMGLTPNVRTAETATAGEGQGETSNEPKPMESAQSPVPYGVRYVNGKPVTEWLLPDGTLTTDLVEADKAEYGARAVRLRNQFVDRMKQNGLDPSKQEDVQKQSQIDAETEEAKFIERTSEDANNVVAELWQEAEEKHKADKNANADREWSRYAAMGGGREMRVVTASANRHADQVSHMTRFDLEKMMETTWARVGNRVTAQCYNRLRTQYPQATEEELQKAATDMARGLTDSAVFQYAVKQNTPKSTLEFFGRTVADANVLNSIGKGLARSQAGTSGDLAAYEQAMGEYGKNHRVAQIGGTVAGMAIDPVTYISGGMGSLFGKGAMWAGGRFLASRAAGMSAQAGTRLFSSSLSGRLLTGAAAGAGNFMTFETLKEAENQFLHGGHINEHGENEGYSAQALLKSAGKGLILGGVTGTMTPLLGNVTDKAVKATQSTAGKVGLRATELGVSTIAEGTVFALPEWYENSKREDGDPNKQDNFDIWTDNLAMMLGFKVSHGIKSAPRVIASLRPIKPADGRPLTQAERNHNRMNFEERVRKALDPANPNNLTRNDDAGRVAQAMRFTADEREELRRAGYGELADIFSRDREQTISQPNPADGAIELRTERAEAEEIRNGNPEFDGYSDMERLMQDGRVSQAARAKAYYVLTGRMLPMGTVTGWTKDIAEDGRVTINAVTADGEVVTSRTFANEKAAEQETNNISRQAELNSVDVGERYREALADEMLLEESISQVSPGADMETVKRIYRAVKAGNKDMTEEQAALAGFIDEAIERNRDMADRHRPEAIRAELREEYGIGVDDALRKTPDKRTAKEKEIVQTYLERLFPEEARERAEEPTPEQEEAQGLYEEGKLLYGRYEEGDPNVTAEVDAIVIRMQEANQIFEDAFGAESEYYRFHLNENPWGLINDPALTAGQQDAVLYYINAKAALDGVMDASHEAADRKRAEVEQSVAKRTHKDTGAITPATMKVNDRQVYIVKGDVAMYPDGSGVDAHNSSESIVVMDAESGEYEFTSPDQIFSVGENIDPEDEMRTALEAIEQERDAIFGENGVAPTEEPGETPAPMDGNNDPQNIPAEGNIDAENIPQAADTEAYDRGYEHGIKVSTILPDNTLNETITELREREFLSDEWRGVLEAYEYEQQRRAMETQSVPENAESVPNPTENVVSEGEIVPEAVSNEPQEGTALSRIPLHEETGEPMFEAVEKELAWDGLVEAVGNDKDAAEIAEAQIAQTNAELEALKKKPPTMKAPKLKGSPMAMAKAKQDAQAKYAQELADYNQRLAETQEKANAWTSILGVHRDRTSELRRQQEEERRQRDAELHDQAVAQFEEEMRLKAERDAEQAAIGTHAVNPKIKEKWDSANKAEGNADAITLPDGSTIRGRYVLTEAGAASASHDVNNAYEPTEGFPIDANGQSVNDRDYLRDKDAQRIVEQIAGAYDNRALQTPVIVSRDGVVLSGNNRTMSGDLAARQGTDKAYTDYLREFGAKYGFTPEQVNGMEHPRLVFVPDEALPYDATTFSRFNAQEMKSQSKPEAAVKLGKTVPDEVFAEIVGGIAKYDRLTDYYRDEEAAAQALGALMQAGVINDKQMPELRTGTALSAAGKELIENTLIGKVFQTSPDAVHQIIANPSMRQTVVMGLSEIANNRTLSKKGYDLSEELSAAVDLVSRAKAAMPDVYAEGIPVSPFGRIQGLFDDNRVTDATTLLLADILNSNKPSDLRKILSLYNSNAQKNASGQYYFTDDGDIMPPKSKNEVLTEINDHFRNATPKEQQALVDAAIEERKRRAEAEAGQRGGNTADEQTPNADERGGERGEPTADEALELEPLGKDRNDPNEDTPEEAALRARIGIGDEWEENGPAPDKPIYKRKLYIDGKHEIIQTDAPDDKGTYMGSRLTYEGRDYGDHKEIADYIDGKVEDEKTSTAGLDDMSLDGVLSFQLPADARKMTVADVEAWEPLESEKLGAGDNIAAALGILEGRIDPNEEYYLYGYKLIERSLYKQGILSKPSMDVNTNPTEAQKKAGNYKKGHVRIEGMDISIENPRNSMRSGTDADGNAWETRMTMDYGYIRGTQGKDKDHIDIFLSEIATDKAWLEEWDMDKSVYVIDQYNKDGSFDEHKVVFGVMDEYDAKTSYLGNYSADWAEGRRIEVTEVPMEDFKKWAFDGRRKIKPFADYKAIKALTKDAEPIMGERPTKQNYTITPTTYTNKKGKTSDVWVVKFDRDLSKEQKAALDSFSREPLTEGKKTSRGWYDRKEGGYMMRSEEAARQLAEMIGNEEAVSDAQPLTADELRDAVAPSDKPKEKKPAKPKKAPINRVSLEDVMTDLSEKGETKLSDHAEPVKKEPETQHEISDDEMNSLADELRDLLGIGEDEGDGSIRFRDPGELTPQERQKIQSAGIRLAMGMIERGVTKFPDLATKMVAMLGDKIRPWLKSFYEGARWTPGYDKYEFTPTEEVAKFDVQNFDKPTYDPIKDAEMRVEERKAQTAAEQAEKELKETRNKQRKEDDKQREADTEALGEKADTVAGKAEDIAKTSEDERELNEVSDEIDETIDEINDQLALLGYYEADLDSPEHEVYGLRRSAEKKAVKDAVKLAKQLVDDLGIEIDKVAGKTTEQMQKSRGKKDSAVRANIAQVGGDITVNLPYPDGRNLHINIGLSPTHERGVEPNRGGGSWEGDNYEVDRIMFRFGDSHNHFLPTDVTYGKMLDEIQRAAKWGQPKKQEAPKAEPQEETYHGTVTLKDGREAVVIVANHTETMGEPARLTDYIVGVKGEPGTFKISPEEIAHAGAPTADDIPSHANEEESHNGYKRGDEVMWDRYGNGKWEKVKIEDFDADGSPIFESVKGIMSEKGDWSRVKPTDGVFGEAKRVATKAQEDKKKKKAAEAAPSKREEEPSSPGDKPADAIAQAVEVLSGGKKKPTKKKKEIKPEQPVGDLFGGLFDYEPETPKENEKRNGNKPSQELAGGERAHAVGEDETGTDGRVPTAGTEPTGKGGAADEKGAGVERGTDGATHGTDEDRGLQQSAGDRGRDEGDADSGSAGADVERGGTTGEGTVSKRGTDRGGEGLSNGEPATESGRGSGTPAVKKARKPEARYTRNFRYDEQEGNEADTYTPSQRLEANVKAIETLAEVLFGDKPTTEEQRAIMSRFRGWGQVDLGKYYNIEHILRETFSHTPINRLARAIQKLDPQGDKKLFDAIKRASLSSYYTPTPIARAMNTFLSLAGYKGGALLDPSMGNGMYEGTLPKSIQERTAITGVELDWLSGQLSRQLYPDANVIIGGFEKSGIAPGSFDVVTSNVPFGDIVVNDPTWKNDATPLKRSAQNRIHNYYAVKMLEAARPGGLVAMLTTSAVMDTPSNQNIRAHIADQGEILGAIRLPDNTFQGTGVVTDILFIRKWRDDQDRVQTREDAAYKEQEQAFLSHFEKTAPNKLDGKEEKVQLNGYFEKNPRNLIGEVQAGNQYGKRDAFGLTSKLSVEEIASEIEKAIKRIVGSRRGNVFNPTRTIREAQQAVREAYKGEGDWVSNGNLVIQDGKVGVLTAKRNEYGEVTRMFEAAKAAPSKKELERTEAMISVRTAMKKLIAGQIEGAKEQNLTALRTELQKAYDNFVGKYGRLQDKENSFILDDIDGYTLQALERWKNGKFEGLSDIFTKNSIKPALKLDGKKTPQEAVALSLAEYGYLRPDYLAKALGEDWAEQCGDFVFLKPNSEDDYATRDEYLSGDVVSKLAEARAAAEKDKAFERNVKALEEVQPERIPFDDIAIHLGARWIPESILNDFVNDLFGIQAVRSSRNGTWDPEKREYVYNQKSGVRYIPETDSFEINIEKKELGGAAQDWETPRKTAKEILQAALEDKTLLIKYKDKEGNEHIDEEQTELANQKIADLRERFESWLPSDPERVETLEQTYNDRFNRTVIRHFNGSHLVVPGLMGKELRPHQKDAVWMLINNRGGIVDHIVGAGKTLVMQSAIMEMRRMGIAKKPMIVALKSTVSQIAREFKEAFPSARVLAPNDSDFKKENRKKFIANISLNDYDCIILSHEQYCMLPHTEEAERAVIDEQLWQLNNMIEYLYGTNDKSQMTKKQIKALEKRRNNLTATLEKRLDRNVDREFCFENLGVDYMFVDESHQFRTNSFSGLHCSVGSSFGNIVRGCIII